MLLEDAQTRVDVLVIAGKFGTAERRARRYLKRFPGSARLHLSLGVCLMLKDPVSAKRELRRAVELGSADDLSVVLEAAQAAMTLDPELGREFAIVAAEQEPAEDEDRARLAYLRGRYSEADGATRDAELYLREAVRLDPADPIYAEQLVAYLVRHSRTSDAREASDAALKAAFDVKGLLEQRVELGLNSQ